MILFLCGSLPAQGNNRSAESLDSFLSRYRDIRPLVFSQIKDVSTLARLRRVNRQWQGWMNDALFIQLIKDFALAPTLFEKVSRLQQINHFANSLTSGNTHGPDRLGINLDRAFSAISSYIERLNFTGVQPGDWQASFERVMLNNGLFNSGAIFTFGDSYRRNMHPRLLLKMVLAENRLLPRGVFLRFLNTNHRLRKKTIRL